MLTDIMQWFEALDSFHRVALISFVITMVLSLMKRLVKLAILVTLLLIAIFVLRAVMESTP